MAKPSILFSARFPPRVSHKSTSLLPHPAAPPDRHRTRRKKSWAQRAGACVRWEQRQSARSGEPNRATGEVSAHRIQLYIAYFCSCPRITSHWVAYYIGIWWYFGEGDQLINKRSQPTLHRQLMTCFVLKGTDEIKSKTKQREEKKKPKSNRIINRNGGRNINDPENKAFHSTR